MNLASSIPVIVSGAFLSVMSFAQAGESAGDGGSEIPVDQEFRAEGDTDSAPSYAEISSIIASNCLSCHGASRPRKGVRLDTEEFARQFASRASREIQDGAMPPRKPGFGQSPEGQRLLEWFSQVP